MLGNRGADGGEAGDESVDFAQFDAMIDSPESPCVEIYRDFVKSAEESLARMRDAVSEGRDDEVESVAHQLKGASASFGLAGFSARMAVCEAAAREGGCSARLSAASWYDASLRLLAATTDRVEAERGIGV